MRSGLITLAQLQGIDIFARHLYEVQKKYPEISGRRLIHETVRSMINSLVTDLTLQSKQNIASIKPANPEAVRAALPLIEFSGKISKEQQALKSFLRENLYKHFQVMRMSNKSQHTITRLFDAFSADVRLLPNEYQQKFSNYGHQAIADYIAGMTDRFAIKEYQRIFAISEN